MQHVRCDSKLINVFKNIREFSVVFCLFDLFTWAYIHNRKCIFSGLIFSLSVLASNLSLAADYRELL